MGQVEGYAFWGAGFIFPCSFLKSSSETQDTNTTKQACKVDVEWQDTSGWHWLSCPTKWPSSPSKYGLEDQEINPESQAKSLASKTQP